MVWIQLPADRPASSTRRSPEICVGRLLSSTIIPGQTAAMISSLETSSPGRATNTLGTSSEREPSNTGTATPSSFARKIPPARRSRRKPSSRKIPSAASASMRLFPTASRRATMQVRPTYLDSTPFEKISEDLIAASLHARRFRRSSDPRRRVCRRRTWGGQHEEGKSGRERCHGAEHILRRSCFPPRRRNRRRLARRPVTSSAGGTSTPTTEPP